MKKDLLEKGAIVQRDQETFAIAPHIPGGITSPKPCARLPMLRRNSMPKR